MADYAGADPATLHPGAILREAREARRLSVEEVAQALKLTPKQVAAIESEEFDLLPGNTFARGFVRNYARAMQLDPMPLLAAVELRLSRSEVDLSPPSNAAGTMPAGTASRGVPRILLAGLMLAIVALAVGVYVERFQPDIGAWQLTRPEPAAPAGDASAAAAPPSGESIELPPPAHLAAVPQEPTAAAAAPAAAVPVAIAPQPAAATVSSVATALTAPARRLQFRFEKESWVEVRDGAGKMLASQLNAPGAVLELEGQPPFTLVVGNAAAVQLRMGDRVVDLRPHTSDSVARLRLD